jgi:hypothetical protein
MTRKLMNDKSIALITAFFIVATMPPIFGRQNDDRRDSSQTVTLAAGPEYEAGSLHRFFFGSHYRDLWATPLKVEVLDLNRFAGGLTPLRRGGRRQTKSLRFLGEDGRQYVFRSIDKDPSRVLPPELQETLASDIIQDQISSAHPFAALVVGPLAKALGVLYAEPRLAVMPDDPKLGEFRAEFRQLMGFIEERPNDGLDGEPGFAGSDKIVATQELFAELEKDHDNDVDSEAYLTARLLDIFVGDWDRHVGHGAGRASKRTARNSGTRFRATATKPLPNSTACCRPWQKSVMLSWNWRASIKKRRILSA